MTQTQEVTTAASSKQSNRLTSNYTTSHTFFKFNIIGMAFMARGIWDLGPAFRWVPQNPRVDPGFTDYPDNPALLGLGDGGGLVSGVVWRDW